MQFGILMLMSLYIYSLQENLPNNTFYREIQARMRDNPSYNIEEVVAE
jgi:hypothetical protein